MALNKCDALAPAEIKAKRAALSRAARKKVVLLSGVAGTGVKEVVRLLFAEMRKRRAQRSVAARKTAAELEA